MRNIYTLNGIVKLPIAGIINVSAGNWTKLQYINRFRIKKRGK